MCGIAGISSTLVQPKEYWLKWSRIFSKTLEHRGPDDEGYLLIYRNEQPPLPVGNQFVPIPDIQHMPVGLISEKANDSVNGMLLHRRLSIIGLGPLGHQPMCDKTGRYWITYNGEIFNFAELQRNFGIANPSGTDTEILVNIWALKQEKCLHLLDGFFAFCVYDSIENTYTVVRDRTGVKPLFFTLKNDCFAFASEELPIRLLLNEHKVNQFAIYYHLKHGMTDVLPWFKGVQSLTPGEYLTWSPETRQVVQKKWFRPGKLEPFTNDIELREMFMSSMLKRLRSDVKLGFAVSGGIDSAVIVGAARHLLGADATLDYFSVGSNNLAGDESRWQKMVVDKNKGTWHRVMVEDFTDELLPRHLRYTNRPAVAWNNLAHFALCQQVQNAGVTVLFNGQGADEIFGGYPDYFIQTLWSERKLLSKSRKNWPIDYGSALKFFLKRKLKNAISAEQKLKIEQNYWGKILKDGLIVEPLIELHPEVNSLQEMMLGDYYGKAFDDKFYGKLYQMLAWEDRNGMSFQLESRNPFADDINIPQKYLGKYQLHELMKNGLPKGLLRDAFKDLLPQELYVRTDKKGFSVPESLLTQKHGLKWKDAFMYEGLNAYVKRGYRESILNNFNQLGVKDLQFYFRVSSLGFFLSVLDYERQ